MVMQEVEFEGQEGELMAEVEEYVGDLVEEILVHYQVILLGQKDHTDLARGVSLDLYLEYEGVGWETLSVEFSEILMV